MRTKSQHYVPQAYLKLFSEDGLNIWVYDKVQGTIRSQRIHDTGTINNLYTSKRHPHPLDIPVVSSLEGLAINTIKKINAGEKISPKDISSLLNFISLQFLRTPVAKNYFQKTFKLFWYEIRKRVHSGEVKDTAKVLNLAQSFIKEQGLADVSPEQFLDLNFEITFPSELFPDSIVMHGYNISKILANQSWEFLFADKEDVWVTNDNPFTIFDSEEGDIFPSLKSNIIKIIPLSNRTVLTISGNGFKVNNKIMFSQSIKTINLGLVAKAKRFVFSDNESTLKDLKDSFEKFEADPNYLL